MGAPPSPPVRLMLIGAPDAPLRQAAEMAREAGAAVSLSDNGKAALTQLRQDGGELVMMDVMLDVPGFLCRLKAERMAIPVIACGIDAPAERAVAAVRAGAGDYLPLPPQRDLVAAAIASVAGQKGPIIAETPIESLVGRSMADVERELILHTLRHCRGNRTSASSILGISVRTMRNKLRSFVEAGFPVASE